MIPSLKSFWNLLESIFVYRWEHELFLYLLPLPLILLLIRYLIRRNSKSKVVLSFIKPIKKSSHVNFRMRTSSRLGVYNVAKEEVDSEDVEEGKEVSCITQMCGIWFTKSRFTSFCFVQL